MNRGEGYCARYRERFHDSNFNNRVHEDPSSYERRIQQNLHILSQLSRYNGGENRTDRGYSPCSNLS